MPPRRKKGKKKTNIKGEQKDMCKLCKTDIENEDEMGKMWVKNDLKCHFNCLLFASGLPQDADSDSEDALNGFYVNDVKKEIRRGGSLKCAFCKEKGATVGCCEEKCKLSCHFTCGMNNHILYQYSGRFKAYCVNHRPFQEQVNCANDKCCICLESKQSSDEEGDIDVRFTTIITPCCSNWLHKKCIQNQAYNSGKHYLKCPMCKDVERYRAEMYFYGIQIPNRDASWEKEGNAYREQLETHSRCDASECRCPFGINYDESPWDILACDFCSSQGTHTICANLHPDSEDWMCQLCRSVLFNGENNPNQKNILKFKLPRLKPKRVRKAREQWQYSMPLKKRRIEGWNDSAKNHHS